MKRLFCVICVWILAAAPASNRAVGGRFSKTVWGLFDTFVTLTGYCESQAAFDETADGLTALLRTYDRLLDGYTEYPDTHNVWYLNRHAAQSPVRVDAQLFDLIDWCLNQTSAYPQKVNIAMGAALSIWHDCRETANADAEAASLPDAEALQRAAAHIDPACVRLDREKQTVFFSDPALRLDLGAVAKGYVADRARDYLAEKMPSFLLSLGGNVIAGDAPRDGRGSWRVAVQRPDDEASALDVLSVSRTAVVTSGDYQRYFTVDGVRYAHIIDPDTLYPPAFARAVTVICADALTADYLSTTLFLLPVEEGLALVNALPGVEALWVLPDGDVRMTPGCAAAARLQEGAL